MHERTRAHTYAHTVATTHADGPCSVAVSKGGSSCRHGPRQGFRGPCRGSAGPSRASAHVRLTVRAHDVREWFHTEGELRALHNRLICSKTEALEGGGFGNIDSDVGHACAALGGEEERRVSVLHTLMKDAQFVETPRIPEGIEAWPLIES